MTSEEQRMCFVLFVELLRDAARSGPSRKRLFRGSRAPLLSSTTWDAHHANAAAQAHPGEPPALEASLQASTPLSAAATSVCVGNMDATTLRWLLQMHLDPHDKS